MLNFAVLNELQNLTILKKALMLSVPEHNSSPITILLLSERFKIPLNSLISTAKDDLPLNKLSLLFIRVNKNS